MIFTRKTTTTTADEQIDLSRLRIVPAKDKIAFSGFISGVREIDSWAKEKAVKFHSLGRSRVFIAVEVGGATAYGFYVLSTSNFENSLLDEQSESDYYRGKGAPFIYINYLAVRQHRQNCGVGRMLFIHALRQCFDASQILPFCGVALRPLNDRLAQMYGKYGFVAKPDQDSSHPLMVLPMQTLEELFKAEHRD